MRKILTWACLSVTGFAAPIIYTDEATFLAAAGGGTTSESFESATLDNSTTVGFSGGTFTCAGTSYCPGFFGIFVGIANDGTQSVYFASPDSATFTFTSPITAFGVVIGGSGDVGALTLDASLSNGSNANVVTGYVGLASDFTNQLYFGVIDTTPFTSITFTPSNSDDGIFFDSLTFQTAAAEIPEPGSLALIGLGLAAIGLRGALRRRR